MTTSKKKDPKPNKKGYSSNDVKDNTIKNVNNEFKKSKHSVIKGDETPKLNHVKDGANPEFIESKKLPEFNNKSISFNEKLGQSNEDQNVEQLINAKQSNNQKGISQLKEEMTPIKEEFDEDKIPAMERESFRDVMNKPILHSLMKNIQREGAPEEEKLIVKQLSLAADFQKLMKKNQNKTSGSPTTIKSQRDEDPLKFS